MTTTDTPRNQYATAALKEHRATVAGELAQLESQVAIKREALGHLDAVLRMFAPEVDPEGLPKRRSRRDNPYPIPNATRRILGILRRRGEPMSSPDVIDALSAEMAFGPEGDHAVAARVRYALRDLAKDGGPVLKTGWRAEAMWSVR